MTGVRRRIDTDKIKRNKIRVPACIERIGSPTYRGQVEKYYKDLIMRRDFSPTPTHTYLRGVHSRHTNLRNSPLLVGTVRARQTHAI